MIDGKTLYLFAVFLFLGIVASLRGTSIGTDTLTYVNMYKKISEAQSISKAINISDISAPIYIIYAFLLSRIFANPQIITIANSIVIAAGFALYIKRTSSNVAFSSFLYIGLTMYYESMNGARQFMAIALLLNAYYYLENDLKSKRGWFIFLLAVGIHNTAMIFILAILGIILVKQRWNVLKVFEMSMIASITIGAGFYSLLQLFIRYFPRYLMYVNGENPASILTNSGSGRIALLYITLLSVDVLYVLSRPQKHEIEYSFPATILCSVMGIIFSSNILVNRLLWYFYGFFLSMIPKTFNRYEKKKRIFFYGIYFVIIMVFCLIHLLEDKSRIVPYMTFLGRRL